MAVDYIINHDCAVKQDLGGAPGFLQILKYRGYARTLREMMQTDPDSNITEDSKFTFRQVGARGTHDGPEQLSILDMEERASALEKYEDQCRDCSANVLNAAGGCSGAVNYPISTAAEEWLLSRLPENLTESVRGTLLKSFIKDFGRNARVVDAARGDQRCYELSKPPMRTWGKGLFGTTKCTSSTILGNLYGVGEVQPMHGAMMGYFLGAIDQPPTTDKRFNPQWVLNMDQLPEDACVQQIGYLLLAFYQAFQLGVSTYVDG